MLNKTELEICALSGSEAAETALAYRKMLERYEEEWRTGYEINFGTTEIPESETEYWELVELLNGAEALIGQKLTPKQRKEIADCIERAEKESWEMSMGG